MAGLSHIEESNRAAFNNMLKHVQQKGTETVSLRQRIPPNCKTTTPIVQMIKRGPFVSFLSYNTLDNLVYIHSWSGTLQATIKDNWNIVEASANCYANRDN